MSIKIPRFEFRYKTLHIDKVSDFIMKCSIVMLPLSFWKLYEMIQAVEKLIKLLSLGK